MHRHVALVLLGAWCPSDAPCPPQACARLAVLTTPPIIRRAAGTCAAAVPSAASLTQPARQAERGEGWSQGMRFILGGTGVHNSRSFLADAMLLAETDKHPGSEFV